MDSVIRKFPIGIQNFESLINDGYVYVDKTALVYRMATTGRYYFLSRPRRFGKSLLLSTIEAYLSGKKELFKGLAIEKLEQKWEEHPILHLDLNIHAVDGLFQRNNHGFLHRLGIRAGIGSPYVDGGRGDVGILLHGE